MTGTGNVGTSLDERVTPTNDVGSAVDAAVLDSSRNQRDKDDEQKVLDNDYETKPPNPPPSPRKRKSWHFSFLNLGNKSNEVHSAPPVQQEATGQLLRSRSWFARGKSEPAVPPPATTAPYSTHIRSSESDQVEVLSTTSMEKNGKPHSVAHESHIVEFDDPFPIVYGNYSGSPKWCGTIKNPHAFYNQLVIHPLLNQKVEAAYNMWVVWELDGNKEMKIIGIIRNKEQFDAYMRDFKHEHTVVMRKLLVPNQEYFKSGYLVRTKISHGRHNSDKAVELYSKFCEDSLFRKFPRPDIKINVCGVQYCAKEPKLTEITCWIHPIWNMSFNITAQVALLLKLIRFAGPVQKITLYDVSNRSRSRIDAKCFS
ncbi:hypothetical protein Cantr_05566 [Candida viswanathii]|uniref:Uncharacterized protein n=1 Tax=Candida viswanathii TaxID=5486 RepID=A0A367XR69_9ASCO|nr:hypothetical protein Cantr_05566 [Candida viswanathii]